MLIWEKQGWISSDCIPHPGQQQLGCSDLAAWIIGILRSGLDRSTSVLRILYQRYLKCFDQLSKVLDGYLFKATSCTHKNHVHVPNSMTSDLQQNRSEFRFFSQKHPISAFAFTNSLKQKYFSSHLFLSLELIFLDRIFLITGIAVFIHYFYSNYILSLKQSH